MVILSNGFPTNMPDSEKVSQGGPANFARLFTGYITSRTQHRWIGVMLEATQDEKPRLKKIFSFPQREYYRLFVPKLRLKKIVHAKVKLNPGVVLEEEINRLAILMKREKPDVVFLNGFGIFNWMLMKAAHKTGVPTVIQHAGIWTKELRIHRDLYSAAGIKMMEEMEKDSTKLTAAEIFLNEWSKNYYRRNVAKGDPRRTYIIPLPFNFSSFHNLTVSQTDLPFSFDRKKFHIGAIARWDEIKNHKLILGIAKEARRRKIPWQVHAVTSIPDSEKYERTKKEYQKHINVIPSLDRNGISGFCQSVDLLIQPSIFDVSPTVVLEAISSRTPIAISPTVGYVSDFASHGANQWVMDVKNAAAAVKSIAKLKSRRMPAKLTSHLRKAHDQNRVFAAYLKLFAEVQ